MRITITAWRPLECSLSDDDTGRESKQQVLRHHRRQKQTEHERLDWRQRVSCSQPSRQLGRLACRGPPSPLTPRQHQEEHTGGNDDDLRQRGRPVGILRGNSVDSWLKRATAPPTPTTQPTSKPRVLLVAFDNNIRTVAVMVVGLIAMPIARGSSSPIADPMTINYLRGWWGAPTILPHRRLPGIVPIRMRCASAPEGALPTRTGSFDSVPGVEGSAT